MIGHHQATCFFNSKKFSYVCFSSNVSAYKSNLYFDPAMNIIGLSTHVLDLGVSMSSSCTFDFCNNIMLLYIYLLTKYVEPNLNIKSVH